MIALPLRGLIDVIETIIMRQKVESLNIAASKPKLLSILGFRTLYFELRILFHVFVIYILKDVWGPWLYCH